MTAVRRTLAAGLAAVVTVLGACSSDQILQELGPFPCAKDGTCPSGFSCSADAGECVSLGTGGGGDTGSGKPVDSVCLGDDTCNGGDCLYGVCTVVATQGEGGSGCAADRVLVLGACFRACSATLPCPSGLSCIWMDGGDAAKTLVLGCVSTAQAMVAGSWCTSSSSCTGYGSAGLSPFICGGDACALACGGGPGTAPCPPGYSCEDPLNDGSYGCFAND